MSATVYLLQALVAETIALKVRRIGTTPADLPPRVLVHGPPIAIRSDSKTVFTAANVG